MNSFYDHPKSAEPAAPTTNTPATSDVASALYGTPPAYVDKTVTEAQRAERIESTGRSLYSAQTNYSAVIPDDASDVFADVPAAREVMADLKVDAADAAELLGMMRQLPQVSEDDRADWHRQSVDLKIAPADLARAKAFVARDQRVFDLLDRSGLGNHPRVVKWAVRQAREHAMRSSK